MSTILLIEKKKSFQSDIVLEHMARDIDEFELESCEYFDENSIRECIEAKAPDIIYVSDDALADVKENPFGSMRVYGYSSLNVPEENLPRLQIKSIGYIDKPGILIEHMRSDIKGENNIAESKVEPAAKDAETDATVQETEAPKEPEDIPPEPKPVGNPSTNQQSNDDYYSQFMNDQTLQEIFDDEAGDPPVSMGSAIMNAKHQREEEATDLELNEMVSPHKEPTKTVAVFSAKGGVGKTTIACNVAAYLAMTSYKRSRYRVCIIDFDIDFGDVRTVLGYDDAGVDMGVWAYDIRTKIKRGMKPEDINYTQEEIERYLQQHPTYGLYALLAPLMHEKSMEIEEGELQVMLRNIIKNGDFDFVICDTGNNTRDASFFALEAADYVLMIATQETTSATCNNSAMNALKRLDFDLSKVRLIINGIVSARISGIATSEVEQAFHDYPCIARVRRSDDVIKANNRSRPLVLNPRHEISKELQRVVAFLTSTEDTQMEKPKRKLFSFLR